MSIVQLGAALGKGHGGCSTPRVVLTVGILALTRSKTLYGVRNRVYVELGGGEGDEAVKGRVEAQSLQVEAPKRRTRGWISPFAFILGDFPTRVIDIFLRGRCVAQC